MLFGEEQGALQLPVLCSRQQGSSSMVVYDAALLVDLALHSGMVEVKDGLDFHQHKPMNGRFVLLHVRLRSIAHVLPRCQWRSIAASHEGERISCNQNIFTLTEN